MGLTNTASDLLPGTLELLILKSLVSGAKHGYAIVEHLRVTMPVSLRKPGDAVGGNRITLARIVLPVGSTAILPLIGVKATRPPELTT